MLGGTLIRVCPLRTMWRREVAGSKYVSCAISGIAKPARAAVAKATDRSNASDDALIRIYFKLNSALVTVSTGYDDVSSVG